MSRPEINGELVKKVVDKWKQENKVSINIELPKSRVIEDILIRYLEGSLFQKKHLWDKVTKKINR